MLRQPAIYPVSRRTARRSFGSGTEAGNSVLPGPLGSHGGPRRSPSLGSPSRAPGGAVLLLVVAGMFTVGTPTIRLGAAELAQLPVIEGDWWSVAGNPDLGELSDPKQQPVDFAVWQAADGTWQLWSCIRHTRCGGNTRLFYRWEGVDLTRTDWQPRGVAMTADEKHAEAPGGLQAPYVLRVGGVWWMFYGNWHGIALARSDDGRRFERVAGPGGSSQLFTEDTPEVRANTRDPMVLPLGDGEKVTYHCYYTAHPNNVGAVYCRTSKDLHNWSASKIVARGGRATSGPYSAECPFVVARDGFYYLFRTQRYGRNAQTSVYRSVDPLDFGVDDDHCLIGTLPVAAPEIIRVGGQYYIAALRPALDGIQIARLAWPAEDVAEAHGSEQP